MTIYQLAQSYTTVTQTLLRFPNAQWDGVMSISNMQSNAWAVDELLKSKKKLGSVYILNGSFGTLGMLLLTEPKLKIDLIRSFDTDPDYQPIADQLNIENLIVNWKFKAVTMDMMKLNYSRSVYEIPIPGGYFNDDKKFIKKESLTMTEIPDTIINTSCDQLEKFSDWWEMIPKGKLVLLQTAEFNAKTGKGVKNVDEFYEMAPMSRLMYSGERKLRHTKFMLIGIK